MKKIIGIAMVISLAFCAASDVFASGTGAKGRHEAWERIKAMSRSKKTTLAKPDEKKFEDLEKKRLEELERQKFAQHITALRGKGMILPFVKCISYGLKHQPAHINQTTRTSMTVQSRFLTRAPGRYDPEPSHPERVIFRPIFVNQTGYSISAITYDLKITDVFGQTLKKQEVKDYTEIGPWHTTPGMLLKYEYAKLKGLKEPIKKKAAKVEITIKKIAWKDGKVTGNFPPESKQNQESK